MKKKFGFYFLWLSLVCLVVFLLQQIPGFTELFVLNQKAILNYQYWRFVTAIFLHGSITHLIYNLFGLLFFGIMLEKLVGSRRFLIAFFSSGIIANIIAVNFYGSSLGASGAIYGVLGTLTIIRPLMMIWAFGLIMPLFIAAIFWIIGDLLRTFGLFDPGNVGSIAHLSGIAVGFILGFLFKGLKAKRIKKGYKVVVPEVYLKTWEDRHMK